MTTDNTTAGTEETMAGHVDPSQIMQVGMGFWASKTLLSAVELELFTQLGGDALTAPTSPHGARRQASGT